MITKLNKKKILLFIFFITFLVCNLKFSNKLYTIIQKIIAILLTNLFSKGKALTKQRSNQTLYQTESR